MEEDYEKELTRWDLYKSYGEFNFKFEDTVQEFRELLIEIIRISYEYYENEDENEEELEYPEQDRLLKILMNSMGASDIVESCKACFIDYFTRQKNKFGNYTFKYWEEDKILLEPTYNFALMNFKKMLELIQLRNIIIHSHFNESYTPLALHKGDLRGRKDIRSSKGYESRNYQFDLKFFERINTNIWDLYSNTRSLRFSLYSADNQQTDYESEITALKAMNFTIGPSTI